MRKEKPEDWEYEETLEECDNCESMNAKDRGHTLLCEDCWEKEKIYSYSHSDYHDRMSERKAMGLSDF